MPKSKKLQKIGHIIANSNDIIARFEKNSKHIQHEFQSIALELSSKLNDPKHKSLYMKLAKENPEPLLRQALSFAIDYPIKHGYGNNKGKIFMWKLKELKADKSQKEISKLDISDFLTAS